VGVDLAEIVRADGRQWRAGDEPRDVRFRVHYADCDCHDYLLHSPMLLRGKASLKLSASPGVR
jgi:hypothetical protein